MERGITGHAAARLAAEEPGPTLHPACRSEPFLRSEGAEPPVSNDLHRSDGVFTDDAYARMVATLDLTPEAMDRTFDLEIANLVTERLDLEPTKELILEMKLRPELQRIARNHVARVRPRSRGRRRGCSARQSLTSFLFAATTLHDTLDNAGANAAVIADLREGIIAAGLPIDPFDHPGRSLRGLTASLRRTAESALHEHERRCPACHRNRDRSKAVEGAVATRTERPHGQPLQETLSELAVVYESITGRDAYVSRDGTCLPGEDNLRPGFGRVARQFLQEVEAAFPDCPTPSSSSIEQAHLKARSVPRK